MAGLINRTAKTTGARLRASVVRLSSGQYAQSVGDPFVACDWGDYDAATGMMKVICVDYPAEYYAMPRYIGTAELVRECRRSGATTAEAFGKYLVEYLEI